MAKAIKAHVQGRVQGVHFRDNTRQQAENLELAGYAKNLEDGSVEVFAEGDETSLQALIDYLVNGPATAEVMQVDHEEVEPRNVSGFQIL